MKPETITTQMAEIWIREDGITQAVTLSNIHVTLPDATEIIAAISRINHGKPVPVFVDMRLARGIDRESRSYFSSSEGLVATKALALLVESSVSQIMANFFINFSKPAVPTRLFTSEDEAVAWLKTFLE